MRRQCFVIAVMCLILALLPAARAVAEDSPECAAINSEGLAAYQKADYDTAASRFASARECFLKQSGGEETGQTATSYNNMGAVSRARGDYDKALDYYTKALDIRLKIYGEQNAATAQSYGNVGLAYKDKGDYDKALENYKKSLDIHMAVHNREHPDTATCLNNIGSVYRAKGDNEKTLEYFTNALNMQLNLFGENSADTAQIYNNIGGVYFSQAEYDRALEYYTKALNINLKVLGDKHPATATSYNNIGAVYYARSDYDRALDNYIKALNIKLSVLGEEHASTATSYNNIGGVYDSKGDFDRALENYEKALKIDSKVLGEEHASTATDYNNIGGVYDSKGDYDKALENFTRAMNIFLKIYGELHPLTATAYTNAGLAYYHKSDYDKALDFYAKALVIRQSVLGKGHPDTAASYNNIGAAYAEKNNFDRALVNYKKALEVQAQAFGEEHPNIATTYNHIGDLYSKDGDLTGALENYRKALWAVCGQKATPTAADCRPEPITVSSFENIGLANNMAGNYRDAAAAFENAAEALDRLRGEMKSEESKKLQGAKYYEMFPAGVGAFAMLNQKDGDASALGRAFTFAEMGIGRVFLEMLGRSSAVVSGGLPIDVIQEGQALRLQWQTARDAVDKEESKPKDQQSQAARTDAYSRFQQAESALDAYDTRLLKDYPDYAELMRPRPRQLSDIRETVLAPNEAALEYILGESASYLILITKDDVRVVTLPPAAEIEKKVDAFRLLLLNPNVMAKTMENQAGKLYEMLLGPVGKEISGKDRLLIVPTGKLYFLPFEALVDKNNKSRYMVEKVDIRYAPSMNVAYLVAKRGHMEKSARPWLGFGDSVYERNDERSGDRGYAPETAEMVRAYTRALSEDGTERGHGWRRIPGTGEEVKAIDGLFSTTESGNVIELGLDASEKNFKTLAPGGSRYVHVASHGTLGEGGAKQPAVVLSLVGNEGTGEDGFLTMSEIFNMKIPADMVVLSACKTGQGAMEKGEGVAGLSRAFLYAGADSLVVSLWSVADTQTKDLMVSFYKKLLAGTDRETALTQTKREFIKDGLAPYYWAPFVYIGGD